MEKLSITFLVFLLVILHFANSADDEHHWKYPDLEKGEKFEKWPGTCSTGNKQSPISLSTKSANAVKRDEGFCSVVKCKNYEKPLKNPGIENNGHTVQIGIDGKELTVTGTKELFSGEFFLAQFHFHWESEHVIDGQRFPLEMHLVHMNKRYPSVEEAVRHQDGFVVFGVLFNLGNEANPWIEKILQNINKIAPKDQIGKKINLNEQIIMKDCLPADSKSDFFIYNGSLTTPLCWEAVSWIVFTHTQEITSEQIKKFKLIETPDGNKLKNNYRNLQNSKSEVYLFSNKAFKFSMKAYFLFFIWLVHYF